MYIVPIVWLCACDCGRLSHVRGDNLRSRIIQSCGCFHPTRRGAARIGKKTPEHYCYLGARQRCQNPKNPAYYNYGGRGIEFRFQSFEQFFAELGLKPSPDLTIERINNNGHYEPGNVKWATRAEQNRNKRNSHP